MTTSSTKQSLQKELSLLGERIDRLEAKIKSLTANGKVTQTTTNQFESIKTEFSLLEAQFAELQAA